MEPNQPNNPLSNSNEPVAQPGTEQPQSAAPQTAAVPKTEAPAPPSEPTTATPPVTPEPSAAPVAPAASTPAAPVVGGGFVSDSGQAGPVVGAADPLAPPPAKKRRPIKAILTALLVVLLVGAGSAAAYVGIIVPNKPENVLQKAITNTLQAKQTTYKGDFEITPTDSSGGGIAAKALFSGAEDSEAKAAQAKLDLTVSGVNFPIEAKYVNKDAYVKLGDISTLTSLISGFSPELGTMAQAVSKTLSNQWIVFDSTLLNQAGGSCISDASWALTQADIKLLQTQYKQHQFVTIDKTSSDPVNGKKATKFDLSINDDKAIAYGNNLDDISLVKALNKCDKNATKQAKTVTGDHDTTKISVWVDKTKRIVRVSLKTTPKDEKKDLMKGEISTLIGYEKTPITAPANAKPAMQVLAELEAATKNNPALQSALTSGTSLQ
jgi:hypothetical protein